MNIWRKSNPKRVVCSTCSVDGIHGAPPAVLHRVEAWKFGVLYRCSFCGHLWFQTDDQKRIARIQERLLPQAQHWNATPLTLEGTLLRKLAAIGATENSYYQYLGVPCVVHHASGEAHDKALVLFSKQPPHFWYSPETVHWASEIADILPSYYALPLDVRQATFVKQEVKMGFAPVGVVDSQEREYTLSSRSHFLDWQGIKGEEVRLSGRQSGWKKTIPSTPILHYYFVDWFPGCEQMFLSDS